MFLNACNTGTNGEKNELHPFAGVASALIGSGKPAVVAMQFPISDDAAIIFAETFYGRIAQGFSVEQAVSEGRKRLIDRVGSEWATPVLYMRAPDGDLFDRPGGRAAPAPESPAAATPPTQPEPVSAIQPQGLMSAIPEPAPTPWFKKRLVLATLAAAVLAALALAMCTGGDTPPEPEPTATAASTEAADVADATSSAVADAFAAVTPEQWINDPDCKIAHAVLASKNVNVDDVIKLANDRFGATDDPAISKRLDYVVGCIYLNGMENYVASPAAAVTWFEAASGREIPQAKYFVGMIYENGADKDENNPAVPADMANARTNYKDAADGGNKGARTRLDELDSTPADPAGQQ